MPGAGGCQLVRRAPVADSVIGGVGWRGRTARAAEQERCKQEVDAIHGRRFSHGGNQRSRIAPYESRVCNRTSGNRTPDVAHRNPGHAIRVSTFTACRPPLGRQSDAGRCPRRRLAGRYKERAALPPAFLRIWGVCATPVVSTMHASPAATNLSGGLGIGSRGRCGPMLAPRREMRRRR